jgi:hypothetical protein
MHLGLISVGLRAAIHAEHCAAAQTRHLGNIFEWTCVCDTSTNEAAHESDMKIPRASIKREREVRVRGGGQGANGRTRSHGPARAIRSVPSQRVPCPRTAATTRFPSHGHLLILSQGSRILMGSGLLPCPCAKALSSGESAMSK